MTTEKRYNAAEVLVDRNVTRGYGDKTAFLDPDRSLSYAELQVPPTGLPMC